MENKFDPDFGRVVDWDIPLLEGYDFEFLENSSNEKGSHHFSGIKNPDIIQRIDAFGPDAILVFGWAFNSHLKVLRHYSKKILVIFRGDSTLLDKTNLLKNLFRSAILKWVYIFVDYALYVGTNNYNYFKKAGLLEEQLIYAPPAIDLERFSNDEEVREKEAIAWREKLNIKAVKKIFLFAGKLEEKKNVQLLLKSYTESGLSEKSEVVIVGNGKLEEELKKEFGNNTGIHFLDFKNQSEMPTIYRMADIFVLPSSGPGETWGLAINEAMSCGRPVIASDKCGSAIDLIDNGITGFIFKSGDEQDLVAKLRTMASKSGAELKTMGENACNKIANFSYERCCTAVENLVLKVQTNR